MNGNARWRRFAAARKQAADDPKRPGAILLNAWNEYTEGSYLMPDTRHGDAFLKALKKAVTPDGAGTRE